MAAASAEWLLRGQQRQFYFLGGLVGILAGLGAVAFHGSISWTEDNLIHRFTNWDSPWRYVAVILSPAVGGLVVGWCLARFAPQARGSGIPQVKERYFLRFGRIRLQTAAWKFVLGTVSIGSGASLGREGPTVQIAASLASWAGRWLGLAPRNIARLIPMASAGAIAAAFNTPLAAIMFVIEEIMGDLKHRALAGIVLVAVIAAVIERGLLGSSAMFAVPSHEEFSAMQLVWSVLIGVLAGCTSELWVRWLLKLRRRVLDVKSRWKWALPGLGGLATGLIGAAVLAAFDQAGVLGIGYETLTAALFGQLGFTVLLALFAGKFIATIFSYSSGGAGGIFAPTLFIGAMLGGAVGQLAHHLSPDVPSIVSSLAVIGMGAMFAGIIRAPVTSILMIFELTQDYELILPIMLANLIAYAVATRLRRVPIYEALLMQDGVSLRRFPLLRPSEHWQEMPVNTIATHDIVTLGHGDFLPAARDEISAKTFLLFPVLDDRGRYVGMVHRKGIERVAETHPERTVADVLVDPPVPIVNPDQPIHEVVRLFVSTEQTTLPVVSRIDAGRVVGVVTLHDITRQQFLHEERGT